MKAVLAVHRRRNISVYTGGIISIGRVRRWDKLFICHEEVAADYAPANTPEHTVQLPERLSLKLFTNCDASEPTGAYLLGPRRSDILFTIELLVELLSELLGLSDAAPALGKSALYDKSNGDTFAGILLAVSSLLPAVIAEVSVTATLFGTLLEYCTALSVA